MKKGRLRLSVFRSNKYIYAQIIDDKKGETLIAATDLTAKDGSSSFRRQSKVERAKEVGKMLAEKALAKGIKEVYFDRGKFKYHGRVKALAEGAREGGLIF